MIVGILGPNGCGSEFLDWSIQYLSGNTDNDYNTHTCFACNDENSAHYAIEKFMNLDNTKLHSFCFADLLDWHKGTTEYSQMVLTYTNIKFIAYTFDSTDIDAIFCQQIEQGLELGNRKIKEILSDPEISTWDKRELIGLSYPAETKLELTSENIVSALNNFKIKFSLDAMNLDLVIGKLFEYLDLEIKQSRLEHWGQTYNKWKLGINLEFFDDLNFIIQSILNNVSHDLFKYNMSIAKEAIIVSKLLYNHNLELKAYGLDNLPQNTKQLAEILGPNLIHDLSI
jgi:hypothetical protein